MLSMSKKGAPKEPETFITVETMLKYRGELAVGKEEKVWPCAPGTDAVFRDENIQSETRVKIIGWTSDAAPCVSFGGVPVRAPAVPGFVGIVFTHALN